MTSSSLNVEASTQLVGITDLFLAQMKNLTISSTDEKTTTLSDTTHSSSYTQIMVNTEWRGNLTYLDKDKECFPFVLRITKIQKKFIEGLIHWVSLDAVTKWLGKTQEKSNKFIFREYEAVSGAENVELPTNYTCELVGDTILGHLLASEKKKSKKIASLELKFAGIDTPHDGFLELIVNSQNSGNSQKKKKI